MTLDEVFDALAVRGAVLDPKDGGLRYLAPIPLAADDPLRDGIAEHREVLIEMFTYAPGRRCLFSHCYRLLAPGDKVACPDHTRKFVAASLEAQQFSEMS